MQINSKRSSGSAPSRFGCIGIFKAATWKRKLILGLINMKLEVNLYKFRLLNTKWEVNLYITALTSWPGWRPVHWRCPRPPGPGWGCRWWTSASARSRPPSPWWWTPPRGYDSWSDGQLGLTLAEAQLRGWPEWIPPGRSSGITRLNCLNCYHEGNQQRKWGWGIRNHLVHPSGN